MKRRQFIAGLGSAAAFPGLVRAQQSALPVVGFVQGGSPEQWRVVAFRRGLEQTGYVEDKNISIEYRWAEGQNERLPALVEDLVRRRVAVIATPGSTQATLLAKTATQTIPIVFLTGADPVEIGLVASLSRPGTNLTGVNPLDTGLVGKRLELCHELVPAAPYLAFLVNRANPALAEPQARAAQRAAQVLGRHVLILNARSPHEIEVAFETLVHQQAGALLVSADALYSTQRRQLVALELRYAMPAVHALREDTAAGALVSYGSDRSDDYRLVGTYVGRILKGERPADMPVQQPTKFELVINLKTAKALGLTIPETLLATADEVIQ